MDDSIMLHVLCRSEHLLVSIGKLKSHKGQICLDCFLPQGSSQLLTFRFQPSSTAVKKSAWTRVLACQLFCHLQGARGAVGPRIGLVWGADLWDENGHSLVPYSGQFICRKPVSTQWNRCVHVTQPTGDKEEQL